MLYGNGRPDITPESVAYFGQFPVKFGKVGWPGVANGVNGGYFPQDTFLIVPDPQCNPANGYMAASLQSLCEATLNAIARPLPDGTTGVPGQITVADTRAGAAAGSTRPALIVLRNTLPGTRGNLGSNTMENPGTWSFDASASKSFRLGENRSAQLRVDTRNVFNHPTPANPSLNVNSDNPFGEIATKNGRRTFQASLRLNF